MEYILFIHNNVDAPTQPEQWDHFFALATESGIFTGGSVIAPGVQIGAKQVNATTDSVGGFMRFDTNDIDKLHALLQHHPTYLQGGTLELCTMPKV